MGSLQLAGCTGQIYEVWAVVMCSGFNKVEHSSQIKQLPWTKLAIVFDICPPFIRVRHDRSGIWYQADIKGDFITGVISKYDPLMTATCSTHPLFTLQIGLRMISNMALHKLMITVENKHCPTQTNPNDPKSFVTQSCDKNIAVLIRKSWVCGPRRNNKWHKKGLLHSWSRFM